VGSCINVDRYIELQGLSSRPVLNLYLSGDLERIDRDAQRVVSEIHRSIESDGGIVVTQINISRSGSIGAISGD
jgi:hypothetical protein